MYVYAQVEEALIQRKKQELLERYASDALQTQVEESKKLVGLWTWKITDVLSVGSQVLTTSYTHEQLQVDRWMA